MCIVVLLFVLSISIVAVVDLVLDLVCGGVGVAVIGLLCL
jgi:hypothetical protein